MFEAVDAIALLRAVLADACPSDEVARRHLYEARQRRMDPLDYAAHQFGLGNSLVWCRAAIWAGYRFAEHLPAHPALPCASVARLEHLRGVRSLRQHALGEDLAFIAPTFDSVRRLRASWRHDLHRRIRFATPEAIETAIARAASAQLMDYARTETTVRWKGASAGQLGRPVRIGFALLLALTILLVMLSGVVARPFLIPVVALLLMAPGVLRVLAALPGPAAQPVRPLTDVELPLYTVLIPLRDEAQMVPMLRRAMSAIDYPALCIKRTKVLGLAENQLYQNTRQKQGDDAEHSAQHGLKAFQPFVRHGRQKGRAGRLEIHLAQVHRHSFAAVCVLDARHTELSGDKFAGPLALSVQYPLFAARILIVFRHAPLQKPRGTPRPTLPQLS